MIMCPTLFLKTMISMHVVTTVTGNTVKCIAVKNNAFIFTKVINISYELFFTCGMWLEGISYIYIYI